MPGKTAMLYKSGVDCGMKYWRQFFQTANEPSCNLRRVITEVVAPLFYVSFYRHIWDVFLTTLNEMQMWLSI